VNVLADAASKLDAAAVLPGSEVALAALVGQETHFEMPVGVCGEDVHRRATDKAEVYRIAYACGLHAPATLQLRRGDVATHCTGLRFPVVVKSPSTAASIDDKTMRLSQTRVVHTPAELELQLGDEAVSLVQQHVAGELVAMSGVAWNGETICTVHQRARRIEPPVCGTSAFAETTVPDARLDTAVRRLVAAIGCSGIFQAQLIRAGVEHRFIDFNPRPYGSLALAIAAGANLPAMWADLLLGRAPVVASYRVGTRLRIEARDLRAIARMLAAGRFAEGVSALAPRRRTVHAVFSLRDPAPALVLLSRGAGKLRKRLPIGYARTRQSARFAGGRLLK
jgi:predicted ATP-grasp superfamily ATP-dependent carboligase